MKEEESVSPQYGEFIERVEEALQPISPEEAERAAIATLSTLSEVISPDAAKNLGSHLPSELVDKLDYGDRGEQDLAEGLTLESFSEIVADREGGGVPGDEGLAHAIGVMKAVKEAYGVGTDPGHGPDQGIDGTELEKIRDELPEDFAPLLT